MYLLRSQGITHGVTLGIAQGKNVVTEASRALTKAMWAAGPHVLSMQQKAEFAANWVARKVIISNQKLGGPDLNSHWQSTSPLPW